MTRPSLERFTAFGQAAGSNGTVSPGAAVTRRCHRGRWLAKIEARLRIPLLSSLVQGGSVLLTVEIRKSLIADGASVGEATLAGPGRLAVAGYVSTGRGIIAYPNAYIDEDEDATLLAVVWNRDNVLATQTAVDVVATYSDRPIPGADDYHRLGDFSPNSGALRRITTSDPAANTEISQSVGVGQVWRVLMVRYALTTDANAATRLSELQYQATGGTSVVSQAPHLTQAASATYTYVWGKGSPAAISGQTIANAVPGSLTQVILKGGDVIATSTANRQATDNYGTAVILIEEWIVPEVAAS